MKSFLTFIFLLITFSSHAQILELGYGPVSVTGWGNLPETRKINLSVLADVYQSRSFHYTPGARYTYVNSTSMVVDELGDKVKGDFNMFFLIPAAFHITLHNFAILNRMGFGWSNKSFPNENGLHTNFLLEAGLQYALTTSFSFSARYSHISNGYRGATNPGLDNIILATEFHF